jgi:hypothetical protein
MTDKVFDSFVEDETVPHNVKKALAFFFVDQLTFFARSPELGVWSVTPAGIDNESSPVPPLVYRRALQNFLREAQQLGYRMLIIEKKGCLPRICRLDANDPEDAVSNYIIPDEISEDEGYKKLITSQINSVLFDPDHEQLVACLQLHRAMEQGALKAAETYIAEDRKSSVLYALLGGIIGSLTFAFLAFLMGWLTL